MTAAVVGSSVEPSAGNTRGCMSAAVDATAAVCAAVFGCLAPRSVTALESRESRPVCSEAYVSSEKRRGLPWPCERTAGSPFAVSRLAELGRMRAVAVNPGTKAEDTGNKDTGSANTGNADTGADTGFADTGAAGTGAADTAAPDCTDRRDALERAGVEAVTVTGRVGGGFRIGIRIGAGSDMPRALKTFPNSKSEATGPIGVLE
mmetsp:Transcript_24640/g.62373  ORF Transcript_24640/g.62373 Transcript_24640/m.62373 type:complete len:205 (-) Transcript_24640:80-694(-)